jgi:hypothetical protein
LGGGRLPFYWKGPAQTVEQFEVLADVLIRRRIGKRLLKFEEGTEQAGDPIGFLMHVMRKHKHKTGMKLA